MTEVWKPIPGYEGLYEASSLGRVRSCDRETEQTGNGGSTFVRLYKGRVLRPSTHGRYHQVTLAAGGKVRTYNLHALICEAFHGPRPTPAHEAAHWDGNVENNASCNLRWATKLENAQDKQRHGTMQRGENHAHAVLGERQVIEIFDKFCELTEGRTKRAPNGTIKKLAKEYDVTISFMENVIYGRAWKHILGERPCAK